MAEEHLHSYLERPGPVMVDPGNKPASFYGPQRQFGGEAHPADQQVLLRYLLAVGLLDARKLDAERPIVYDYSRSHGVWLVEVAGERRFLVKRARPQPGGSQAGLGAEPILYRMAQSVPELIAMTPACLWIDDWQQIIVLEAVQPGENLYTNHYAQGPSLDFAGRLGAMLAAFHKALTNLPHGNLPVTEPWVFDIMTPTDQRQPYTDIVIPSGGIRREMAEQLAALKEIYHPTDLIHGDFKWANCLIAADGIRVIDWELAGSGDAAWDVAGLLHDYAALPVVQPVEQPIKNRLKACSEKILRNYMQGTMPDDRQQFLHKTIRYTGARLVQSAYEHAGTSPQADYIPALVKLGLEIMRNPDSFLNGAVLE